MKTIFDHMDGFSINEKWGDPLRMNGLLIMAMEVIRYVYRERFDPNASFIIHCGYEADGHVDASEHGKGNADDFHIVSTLPFPQQVKAINLILQELGIANVCGFGIYPDWNNPGFHLDVRGKRARWGRINNDYVSIERALAHAENKEVD